MSVLARISDEHHGTIPVVAIPTERMLAPRP